MSRLARRQRSRHARTSADVAAPAGPGQPGDTGGVNTTIDVSTLYAATGQAKLAELAAYTAKVRAAVAPGAEVTLTGPGPVWLYLSLAHALHGRVTKLCYDSPVTGPVEIFNHDPR